MPLTLDEFRATKVWHDALDEAGIGADDIYHGGYVYDGVCYVEKWPAGADENRTRACWALTIETRQWTSDDLAELEEILYREWYLTEICAG